MNKKKVLFVAISDRHRPSGFAEEVKVVKLMGKVHFIILRNSSLLFYIPLKMLVVTLGDFSYLARPLDEVREASQKERERAFEAAAELQSNLKSGNPSFVNSLVRSHVYSCFWLVCFNGGNLHSSFCLHILTVLYLIYMPYMQRRRSFAADAIASS
jgi:hypothetical protein